jgi:hypothetical protein
METIIKASPVKTRRKFDVAFKLEAVRNWQASGKSAAVVAKELGLAESRLFAWRQLLPPPPPGGRRRRGAGRPWPPTSRRSWRRPAARSAIFASSGTF